MYGEGSLSRFAVLYTFHNITPMVLRRLKRLKRINNDALIVPMSGVQQRLFFPGLMINTRRIRVLNLISLRSKTIYRALEFLNRKVESFRRRSEIGFLKRFLERWGLSLYCNYTPMGWYNQDIAILNWFSQQGKNIDFEYLVFLEYDVYLTRPISDIYSEYTRYDAGFVNYKQVTHEWVWYHRPHKARDFLKKWLQKHGLKTTLYACLFVGNIVSREVLEELERIPYPHYGFCEMRWPTIITALGFKCTRLNFPAVRYRPFYEKQDIIMHKEFGIFHPVIEDISDEDISDTSQMRFLDSNYNLK